MLDAFATTLGDSATKPIADPYKYLMACARNTKSKAAQRGKGATNRMSLDELSDAVDAAYDRRKPNQPQGKLRLTDER